MLVQWPSIRTWSWTVGEGREAFTLKIVYCGLVVRHLHARRPVALVDVYFDATMRISVTDALEPGYAMVWAGTSKF